MGGKEPAGLREENKGEGKGGEEGEEGREGKGGEGAVGGTGLLQKND